MKKLVLSLTMLLATGLSGFAYDFSVEDDNGVTLHYTITSIENLTVNVANGEWDLHKEAHIVIPENVKYGSHTYKVTGIGSDAFNQPFSAWVRCSVSVTIPPSVKVIGKNALTKVGDTLNIYVKDIVYWCNLENNSPEMRISNLFFDGVLATDLTVPDEITNLNCAFRNCKGIKTIALPETIKELNEYELSGCINLTTIHLPESIKRIPNYAFEYCNSLKSIDLPNSVEEIGYNAFKYCSNLKDINFGNSLQTISSRAFENCVSIESIILPNSLVKLGGFGGCTSLRTINWGNNIKEITDGTFANCTSLERIQIPYSVTKLGFEVFSNCTGLKGCVVLHDFIEEIGHGLFKGCENLDSVIIGASIKKIGTECFKGCKSMSYLNTGGVEFLNCGLTGPDHLLPDDYWEYDNFNGCDGLTTLVLGKSLTGIEEGTLLYCNKINSITALSDTPPSIAEKTFATLVYAEAVVNVPAGTEKAYRDNKVWSKFLSLAENALTDCSVSVTAGKGGTVAIGKESVNNGKMTVTCAEGDDVVLTITADKGYKISAVKVDGTDVTKDVKDGKYTLEDVDEDTSITVAFEAMVYERDDVNEDGEVNTADVTHIYNRIIYGKDNGE